MNDEYGKKLKAFRTSELKISQRELAERLGVSRYTIVRIEQGKIGASDTFRKLVENYKEIEYLKALSDSGKLDDAIYMYLVSHYSFSDKFSIISRDISDILDCGDLNSSTQSDLYMEEMYMLIGAFSRMMSYMRSCTEKDRLPKRETIQAHVNDLFSIAVRFAKK